MGRQAKQKEILEQLKKLPDASKDAAKPKAAPKKGKAAAAAVHSDAEILREARTIATVIRGLRHEEEGLASELKEVRARISTQTDHLNELLLDAAKGQSRLNFDEKTVALAEATKPVATPAAPSAPATECTVDGFLLRVTPRGGEFDATYLDTETGGAEWIKAGAHKTEQAARNALLDAVGWHGNAPEWAPVQATQGDLAKAAAKKGVA